jgi:uncharacterized protein YgbK (DUF1537 family)
MSDRWLILADDLTGAADSGVAFAKRGLVTEVVWGEQAREQGDVAVLAYDTDSRRLSAPAAFARQREAARRFLDPGCSLYQKIDSTLRGQPAAEIAALCATLRESGRCGCGIFAPANPAMGRTTRDAHVFVHGEPLEDTETWRRDHSYESADLAAICASAGLEPFKLPLALVRAETEALRAALSGAAEDSPRAASGRVLICDAESDEDLARIAIAARVVATPGFFIGTAGLANALAAQLPRVARAPVVLAAPSGGALIVVGSLASISRRAADELAALPGVRRVSFPVPVLLDAAFTTERSHRGAMIAAALQAGEDVLVEITRDDAPNLALGPQLAQALASCLGAALERLSGLIVTGGETATALLAQWYVSGIRLVDETEPGISLGITVGEVRVPIVTKPGGFGDASCLVRSLERLRSIRHKGSLE